MTKSLPGLGRLLCVPSAIGESGKRSHFRAFGCELPSVARRFFAVLGAMSSLCALLAVLWAGEAAGLPCCASGEKESLDVHIAAFGIWDPWLDSAIFKVVSNLSDCDSVIHSCVLATLTHTGGSLRLLPPQGLLTRAERCSEVGTLRAAPSERSKHHGCL